MSYDLFVNVNTASSSRRYSVCRRPAQVRNSVLREAVRIVRMDRGVIIAQGAPDELLQQHFRGVALQLPREDFDRGCWIEESDRTALSPIVLKSSSSPATAPLRPR